MQHLHHILPHPIMNNATNLPIDDRENDAINIIMHHHSPSIAGYGNEHPTQPSPHFEALCLQY